MLYKIEIYAQTVRKLYNQEITTPAIKLIMLSGVISKLPGQHLFYNCFAPHALTLLLNRVNAFIVWLQNNGAVFPLSYKL